MKTKPDLNLTAYCIFMIQTASGNLAWALVLQGKAEDAQPYFQTALDQSHTEEQWQYHWRRLGLELCTLVLTKDPLPSRNHLTQLETLLGSDHKRVQMAYKRFDILQSLK